ncbi:MAG TPA: acyl-CoA dehydrogenase [Acidimicrobiales bacterium]|nr:acyl-CoA dehydrogenase [Acidimicrobiales bacterium]
MFVLTDEQEALDEAVGRFLAKCSSPEHVRQTEAADPAGFSPVVWQGLVDMGLLDAAASRTAGLTDLAVVCLQAGAHLASVPLAEAFVAARATGEAEEGRITVFAPLGLDGVVVSLVAGGLVADEVLTRRGDRLVAGDVAGVCSRRTIAGIATGDVTMPDTRIVDLATPAQALDEWRALTAAGMAGLARAALDLGVAYVKERHQFGVPIGSFQSIQHRLADLHTAVDGARLLALEAAQAVDDTRDPDGPALAAMAFDYCGQVAEEAALASLHFHGGYGFMLEYDVQLYVRRAKAWRLALGDPRHERLEIARRLWGGGRTGLDRRLDPETEEFRTEVRSFLDEHLTDEIIERAHATGTMHDAALHKAIASRGYLAAGWPKEVGGHGRSPVEMTALMQELYSSGAPVDSMGIASLVAATLVLRGNEHQRGTIVPRILAGDALCCLGYSEPDAGSDVAAVQTRATRDGEEWVINGQKMFTTMAHEADYVFLLTRTSPDKPKHKGLTMFLVPMDAPGIEITPVHTLGGERTNITFYTDVRVPDACRVGEVDAGWSVMHAALVYERNGTNWGEPDRLVRDVAAWAVSTEALDDPLVAERLAVHATAMEVGRLLVYRVAALAATGVMTPVEGSMAQLFLPEAFTRAAGDLLDVLGAHGVLAAGDENAPLAGRIEHAYRHSTVTTIYGGTSEVQRGIIAERGLGLPRTR